ncbi:MAG: hypothetical protein JM58_01045 [Peptococcaceae bacterium BICA1-8]|nr:MAG: hypothetical protein JM58_01045 [Peptococcaceae bacterium BICA1-8]
MKPYLFLFAAFSIFIPISAVRPTTVLFAQSLDASFLQIGFINASYALLPFLFAIYTGRFVDKVGEKLPLVLGTTGLFIAVLLPFFKPTLFMLFISPLILGGSQLLAIVAMQNGVASSVTVNKRDQMIATYTLIASAAQMIGPVIGGYLITHAGFRSTYLFIALFALIPILVSFLIKTSFIKKEQNERPANLNVKELLSMPGLKRIIFVSMLNLAAVDIFLSYYPLYTTSIGFDPSQTGILISIQAMSAIIVRFCIPMLVQYLGRVRVISIFLLIGGAAFAIIPLFNAFIANACVVALLGFGLGITQPLTTILAYNSAPIGRTGEVLGIRMAGNRLSQIILPLILGGISSFTGLGAVFVLQSFLLGAGALLARGINVDKQPNSEGSFISSH